MGYNEENYRRIREEYRTKYLEAYARADARMSEVHAKCPEIARIDRELRDTHSDIALAAIGSGDEYGKKLAEAREKNETLQKRRGELLQQMGLPADYTKPQYECPKCMDSGFIGYKMCDCMRNKLIMAAYTSSGLGALLKTQSFENFNFSYCDAKYLKLMQENFRLLKNYADTFQLHSDNLLLEGPTGLGKTHLTTAVAKVAIDGGFDVYYTSALQMFSDFEYSRFGQNMAGEQRSRPSRYYDCDLLIVDDLGTEMMSQFNTSCLYEILNRRINMKKPMIINTNLTPAELQKRYADRITSRLVGEFKILLFQGTDVRMKKLHKPV